jgi:hypothetical protein
VLHGHNRVSDDYEQYAQKANELLVHGADKNKNKRDINPRLRAERYEDGYFQQLKADRPKDGRTITENVYGDQSSRGKRAKMDVQPKSKGAQDDRRTGREVPFFPSEWNKSANLIFNEAMEIVDIPNGPPAIAGARPTSGKHYSRHFKTDEIAQFFHKATQPPGNSPINDADARSFINHHVTNTKKIKGLMDKL